MGCLLLLSAAPIATQKQSGKDNWPSFPGDHAAGLMRIYAIYLGFR
jgi:hypothetical protein